MVIVVILWADIFNHRLQSQHCFTVLPRNFTFMSCKNTLIEETMKPLFDIDLTRLESEICDIKFELSQIRYLSDCEAKMQECSKKMHQSSRILLSIICLQEYKAKQADVLFYNRQFRVQPSKKILKI
jgi:hypothetical protein